MDQRASKEGAVSHLVLAAQRAFAIFAPNMPQNTVTFHYTLRDASGRLLDTSIAGEPITYVEGAGQIIDGLEEHLRGLAAGTKSTVTVPAAKAYGERDSALLYKVKRALLPVDGEVKTGDRFRTSPDPTAPVVTVAAVEGDEITLDANHPYAGADLTFHVEVLAVREATAEEIEQIAASRRGCGCGCGGGCDCDCGDGAGDCSAGDCSAEDCGDEDCDCESGDGNSGGCGCGGR